MTAPDPFGTPGWDELRRIPHPGPLRGPDAAAVAEMVRRQPADRAAREEAAIRSALTERVKAALIQTVDDGEFGDASGHLGGDGFDALAAAAVGALEQFYRDGHEAMRPGPGAASAAEALREWTRR